MNDTPHTPKQEPARPVYYPELNCYILRIEDGEIDTTVRPSRYSLPLNLGKGPEVSEEEAEFVRAFEQYRNEHTRFNEHIRFLDWSDVLHVLRSLNYRKTATAERPGTATPAARSATIQRETAETKIDLTLNLDGTGRAELATGVGFFDHMLTLLAKHSLIDLTVQAAGDLHVDPHHTVEDVGICFGQALAQALGDKAGIRRYGSATLPMDEVLVTAAVDLSGRPFCVWHADLPPELLGTFNAPLAEEFWRAVSSNGAFNLHVICHHGGNTHHIIEAIFKAVARALRQAVEPDPRGSGVPSTKGVL